MQNRRTCLFLTGSFFLTFCNIKLKYKYIDFNRENFHSFYENVMSDVQVAIISDEDPEQTLLNSLKGYNIYERKDDGN